MGRYHRVDLHIHSPISTDYSGDKNVSAQEFVSAFADRGFDLIAITDHNSGSYVDQAIEARNQLARNEGKNITVLPGVEMHVSPGIHLLAILPAGGSADIADLLSYLGLHVDQHGNTDALISKSISEIADSVHERGGLLVGAHCNSNKGVVQVLTGQPRLEWLSALDALEISSDTSVDKIERDVKYVNDDLGVSIPFIFSSDSHDCASETDGMWVKMAELSMPSLKQLVFEPELRISRSKPNAPTHGRIIGFTTTCGIYANERFRFSPNLNVLVGGRGAGKSAAIDVLRFAFEAEPKSGDVNETGFIDRIMSFLQGIGEVMVVAVGVDGETYVITRSGAYEQRGRRGRAAFTESAQVFQLVGDHLVSRDIRPSEVVSIEFYGQGEAARLADRVDEQLRLVDENLDLSGCAEAVESAEKRLSEAETQIIERVARLEALRVEASRRPQLEQRRDSLSKSLDEPIFAERLKWDQDKDWVQRQQAWARTVSKILPASLPSRTVETIDFDNASVKSTLQQIWLRSNALAKRAQDEFVRLRVTLEQSITELKHYEDEWNEEFKISEALYVARLAELGAQNKEAIATELRGVEADLQEIETSVDPEIAQMESQIASLERERTECLESLSAARAQIDRLRLDFVCDLNSQLAGDVEIDLSEMDDSGYLQLIDLPLEGSGMQRRGYQIGLACESFAPEELVSIIRGRETAKLEAVGITEHSAQLMMQALTEEILYKDP